MRIIATMMILIMMTSTLAGCTSQADGVSEIEEGDIETILNFIDEAQEPDWINDRGNSQHQWQISLPDNQWLEIKSTNVILNQGDQYLNYGAFIYSDDGYIVHDYSPIFGGNYTLCLDLNYDLTCSFSPSDPDRILEEWSVIYKIHNASQTNYYFEGNSSVGISDIIENTNITMQISYVPNGMDEGGRTNATVVIELYSEDAPNHVDSFLTHIVYGNYNSAIFHRIINGFMIQGGDFESGTGTGGYAANWYGYCNGQQGGIENDCSMSDWTIPDEADNGLSHTPGALSMAKTSAPDTGGSQFFIVPSDSSPSHLNGVHTVFGYVTSGLDSITDISDVATTNNDRPVHEVIIVNISINES